MKAKPLWLTLLACLVILSLPACATKPPPEEKSIPVTDSAGREVSVVQPLERVVVLASQPAEVIAALGGQDKVVGVTQDHVLRDPLTRLVYQGRPSVGNIMAPSLEAILELEPQLVISISGWAGGRQAALSLDEQLSSYGIPVALIDCFPDVDAIFRDSMTLGKLFGKEDKAQEYIDFFQEQLNLVAERTQGLGPSQKVKAYIEMVDYTITLPFGTKAIAAAGGIDIAEGMKGPHVQVSPEWVLEKNPQVVIARGMPPDLLGYGVSSEERARKVWEGIVSRPGWATIEAVKNKKVYLLAFEICTAPRAPIGILHMAKWFYPDLFQDLHPEAVHHQFLKRFFGLEEYPGIFVYPGP